MVTVTGRGPHPRDTNLNQNHTSVKKGWTNLQQYKYIYIYTHYSCLSIKIYPAISSQKNMMRTSGILQPNNFIYGWLILLMEEIRHHLGWLKPYKKWNNHHPWCRILSINSPYLHPIYSHSEFFQGNLLKPFQNLSACLKYSHIPQKSMC